VASADTKNGKVAANEPPLAIVTGASSGIGLELARCCAREGFDLVIAADESAIERAAAELRQLGVSVVAVETDLSLAGGVDMLYDACRGRAVEYVLANAGRGLGGAFLDQDFGAARRVLDTNVTGTLYLLHRVGHDMRARGHGRILITGSVAGFIPGSFNAVYNASKAFLDLFSYALRNELKDSGVTVTCLMPGTTDTAFFERAGLLDTELGRTSKADPADVAKAGFKAMLAGSGGVITGVGNKLRAAAAHVAPAAALAEVHRAMAEPGSATR
jgi:uncharacterized protein